jgi:hypothetical protein
MRRLLIANAVLVCELTALRLHVFADALMPNGNTGGVLYPHSEIRMRASWHWGWLPERMDPIERAGRLQAMAQEIFSIPYCMKPDLHPFPAPVLETTA